MNEPRSVFDFLRARGEEFFNQISNELMSNPQFLRAMQAAWKGKERIDDAVSQALRSMNVPTRAEFKKVMARLEALEREQGELRQGVEGLRAEAKKAASERAAARTAAPVVPPAPRAPVRSRTGKKRTTAKPVRGTAGKTGGTPAAG